MDRRLLIWVVGLIAVIGCDSCPPDDTSCKGNESIVGEIIGGESTAGENAAGESTAGESAGSDSCVGGLTWLTVPIRFHLLSSEIETLNASFTEVDVHRTVAEAAEFWEQACIRFEVESVITSPITREQEQQYREQIAANPMSREFRLIVRDVMPTENHLSPGWNVMIFKRFPAPASGIYLTEIKSVLWSEELPPNAPITDNPSIILSHEFGHSFGLPHFEGEARNNNLMNAEIMQTRSTAHRLTEAQIMSARHQVERGDPTATAPR